MKAVRVNKHGGSEVLSVEEMPVPEPKAGQLLIRMEAIGINFLDTYQRSGLYPIPTPFTPGNEGAGVVEKVGEGVSGFAEGDRIAYTSILGSYSEYTVIPANRAVKMPAGLDSQMGAAIMLQGITAQYLSTDTYPLKAGDWCLIHAGAGGVGLLLIQMAKMKGANVITTVSTDEKEALAKGAGADHVIQYTKADFEEECTRILSGKKLDVVYDSVASTTFEKGLNLLRLRGLMVLYGQSSGPVPPFELGKLSAKGSLYVTRPTLASYIATDEELHSRAGEVLGLVSSGKLDVRIGATFPLVEAKAAHDALEGRQTTGKVLLIP